MSHGFTPAEIDAMPAKDVEAFVAALPTVRELMLTAGLQNG